MSLISRIIFWALLMLMLKDVRETAFEKTSAPEVINTQYHINPEA